MDYLVGPAQSQEPFNCGRRMQKSQNQRAHPVGMKQVTHQRMQVVSRARKKHKLRFFPRTSKKLHSRGHTLTLLY